MDATFERARKLIADTLGIDQERITPDTDLYNDLGADSLDVVELTVMLEKEFKAAIPDEMLETMRKVRDFIDYFSNVKHLTFENPTGLRSA